jgi:hypothetical protein
MAEITVWVAIPKDARQSPYTVGEEQLVADPELREITRLVPERIYNEYHQHIAKAEDVRKEMRDHFGKPELRVVAVRPRL